jgi:hypothetical protein
MLSGSWVDAGWAESSSFEAHNASDRQQRGHSYDRASEHRPSGRGSSRGDPEGEAVATGVPPELEEALDVVAEETRECERRRRVGRGLSSAQRALVPTVRRRKAGKRDEARVWIENQASKASRVASLRATIDAARNARLSKWPSASLEAARRAVTPASPDRRRPRSRGLQMQPSEAELFSMQERLATEESELASLTGTAKAKVKALHEVDATVPTLTTLSGLSQAERRPVSAGAPQQQQQPPPQQQRRRAAAVGASLLSGHMLDYQAEARARQASQLHERARNLRSAARRTVGEQYKLAQVQRRYAMEATGDI